MNEPIKIPYKDKIYYGFKKCPNWLRKIYESWAKGICMDCKRKRKLEPHRIIRGVVGGLYTFLPFNHPLSNVKMLCHECHEKYNYSRKQPAWVVGSSLKNEHKDI